MGNQAASAGGMVSVNRDTAQETAATRIGRFGPTGSEPVTLPSQPAPAMLRLGAGQPLPPQERSYFERRLGAELSAIRVHPEAAAATSLGALAFAAGRDIGFAPGQFRPGTDQFRDRLGHELGHVVQQGRFGQSIQLQTVPQLDPAAVPAAGPVPGTSPGAASGNDIRLIPPDWVRQPGRQDILVARIGDHMLALPAAGYVVTLGTPVIPAATPVTPAAAETLASLGTLAKEGLVAVNVGNQTGFLIDAGGSPAVLFPAGSAAIQQALGVTGFRGVAITHIHDDHVQSLVSIVLQFRIRPENLHYPAAFAVNSAAPSSTFANQLQQVQNHPLLQPLGHGTSARYGAIQTPATGNFFRQTIREGDVEFNFYGLSAQFRQLQGERASGRRMSQPDTASLLTRVTHQRSQTSWLYVGDLRGADLTLFRHAMGDQPYTEMLRGVTAIVGLQHHLGTLSTTADRDGLVDLLTRTYLQNGRLTVLAQSQESFGGRQFLNRSLISALTELGIEVHVAMEPGAGGQVSTVNLTTQGVTTAPGGRIQSFAPSTTLQPELARLAQLREAEEILTRYERFLTEPGRQSGTVMAARQTLEQALGDCLRVVLSGVRTGSTGRATPSTTNPADQANALTRVRVMQPIEADLTPANMNALRELRRIGPHREIFEEELAAARTSGRMSDRGIDALWELDPQMAAKLVGESGLSRRQQRQVIARLPGQPLPVRTRVMGGVLLAITVFQEIAPLIQQHQQQSFDDNVWKPLQDILWWQEKGVFPNVQAVNEEWFSSDEWTTSPERIQSLLNAKDIDYLALTGIDGKYWDAFTIWASTHLVNLRDWDSYISRPNVVRSTGRFIDDESAQWQFRKHRISSGTIYGHDLTEEWETNDRLTLILNFAARNMVQATTRQIEAVATGPGPYDGPAISAAGSFRSQTIYAGKPQASRKVTFIAGRDEYSLYTIALRRRIYGYPEDSEFFVFPSSAVAGEIPSGYVLVGGADYNTYQNIYKVRNFMPTSDGDYYVAEPNRVEMLLARESDLRPML